jgi:hypothetical protein
MMRDTRTRRESAAANDDAGTGPASRENQVPLARGMAFRQRRPLARTRRHVT